MKGMSGRQFWRNEMDLAQFLALVEEMRHAQKEYFRTKSNLSECKRLEKKVDLACHRIREGDRQLFET